MRDARRAEGINQSDLGRLLGCKQSALSMFEQGDGTKLSDEVIKKLSERYGLKIELRAGAETPPPSAPAPVKEANWGEGFAASPSRGFCPNPHCPSHRAYFVETRRFLRPDREEQDPVYGRYCAVCGETLERSCPHCGASVHDGAVCSFCGKSYVTLS